MSFSRRSPMLSGVLLALASAAAFGATTPLIASARGAGVLTTAALLYAGAAAISLVQRPLVARSGRSLRGADAPVLGLVALLGAFVAPACLVWGLARTGPTAASLALNLEVVFTVLLASLLYAEPIGPRLAAGVAAVLAGTLLVTLDASRSAALQGIGLAGVVAATAAWAGDNALTRRLSDADPAAVVAAKGALGAALSALLAAVLREPLPAPATVALLLACGATGYGLSLRLYLLAQRRIGAARTGSLFAIGPFFGAALAWLLGDRAAGALTGAGGAALALGVFLLASERHAHAHLHEAQEHEHAHRHDDGHHDHVHEPPVRGEHTHRHRHERCEHAHDHAPDLHHRHGHS